MGKGGTGGTGGPASIHGGKAGTPLFPYTHPPSSPGFALVY
jgi:hypothetical protein